MLTSSISRTVARRFQSTAAASTTKPEVSTTFLTMSKSRTFNKAWLSDPSTYPLLAALGFACFLAFGVGATCLMNSPDVRISQEKKHSVVRNWGLP